MGGASRRTWTNVPPPLLTNLLFIHVICFRYLFFSPYPLQGAVGNFSFSTHFAAARAVSGRLDPSTVAGPKRGCFLSASASNGTMNRT
jgi:hypothetical protein